MQNQKLTKLKTEILFEGKWNKNNNSYHFKNDLIICDRKGTFAKLQGNIIEITPDVCGFDKVYTGFVGNKFLISTSLKKFSSNEKDIITFNFSKKFGYCPYPFTVIEGIRKCPPGLTTKITIKNKTANYEYLPSEQLNLLNKKSKKIGTNEFREKFLSEIKKTWNGPITCSYSFGFDSVLLSTIFADQSKQFIFFNVTDNKIEPKIKILSNNEFIERNLTIIDQNEEISKNDISKFFNAVDEPTCDNANFADYLIARKSLNSAGPLMNGQGADRIFCNGREYFYESIANFFRYPVKSISPSNALNLRIHRYLTPSKKRFLDEYVPINQMPNNYFLEIEKIYDKYHESIQNDEINKLGAIGHMMRASLRGIEKINISSRATNKQYFVPFMNEKIIELAFDVPGSQKVGRKLGKRILRNAFPEVSKLGFKSASFITKNLNQKISGNTNYLEFFYHQWNKSFFKLKK